LNKEDQQEKQLAIIKQGKIKSNELLAKLSLREVKKENKVTK
jgi:hypothetical protein